jgi:hypothetical protein
VLELKQLMVVGGTIISDRAKPASGSRPTPPMRIYGNLGIPGAG